jgi:hypothetical protein
MRSAEEKGHASAPNLATKYQKVREKSMQFAQVLLTKHNQIGFFVVLSS